jgi:hypothetical protein
VKVAGTRFKFVVPMVLALAAMAVLLLTEGLREPEISTDSSEPSESAPVNTESQPRPAYDDKGYRVFTLGATRLSIPPSRNPAAVAGPPENRTVRVTLCWPRDDVTGECPGVESVIVIFLRGFADQRSPIDDGVADLKRRQKSVDGPFESEIDGLWEFRYPNTDEAYTYALAKPDHTGRHPIARCAKSTRCHVGTTVAPGLAATYDFQKEHLELWPEIDQEVREYVTSLIVED